MASPAAAPDSGRDPCPDRILDDVGGAFAMGAIGGSAFYFLKGLHNSPKGERLFGGAQAVRMHAPRLAGGFAVWGGVFSVFDCSMVYLRQKEDPWNSIMAGFATGGFLHMRQGLRSASRSALAGGVLLALIEGAGIAGNKFFDFVARAQAEAQAQQQPIYVDELPGGAQIPQERESSSSSWFGGFFGGAKEEKRKSGGGVKTEVLESFDAPMPPTFEFK